MTATGETCLGRFLLFLKTQIKNHQNGLWRCDLHHRLDSQNDFLAKHHDHHLSDHQMVDQVLDEDDYHDQVYQIILIFR